MEAKDIMRIAAFVPHYQEGSGQGVMVYYRDGTTDWFPVGLRSFIQQLAKVFTVNLQQARRQFGPVVGQQNLIPVVLSPFLLYVPLKTRKPVIAGDPAYGYYRLRSLTEVSASPKPCTLGLEGGQKLTIIQSYRAVCSHLRSARKFESFLLEQFFEMIDSGILTSYMQQAAAITKKQKTENVDTK